MDRVAAVEKLPIPDGIIPKTTINHLNTYYGLVVVEFDFDTALAGDRYQAYG